jgi:hypothetical protein
MTTDTFKDIEPLESDLWDAADNLRANSKLTAADFKKRRALMLPKEARYDKLPAL